MPQLPLAGWCLTFSSRLGDFHPRLLWMISSSTVRSVRSFVDIWCRSLADYGTQLETSSEKGRVLLGHGRDFGTCYLGRWLLHGSC
eukprot:c2029_g1_i1 orf=156-413(+)